MDGFSGSVAGDYVFLDLKRARSRFCRFVVNDGLLKRFAFDMHTTTV